MKKILLCFEPYERLCLLTEWDFIGNSALLKSIHEFEFRTIKILHIITANKLQGKKPNLFSFVFSPVWAQVMNYLGQVPTMGTSHFCSISWLVHIHVAIKHF